ncbi:hypothetical protein OKW41_002658 [Paraburkholderia sp. UCT70]
MNRKKNIATVLVAALFFTGQGFAQGLADNTAQNGSDAGNRPPVAHQGTGPSESGTSRPHMLHAGFKDFHCARVILSGVELMHMIKKGQMKCRGETPLSPAQQFYSLVS